LVLRSTKATFHLLNIQNVVCIYSGKQNMRNKKLIYNGINVSSNYVENQAHC
jgi:hypothetical protein